MEYLAKEKQKNEKKCKKYPSRRLFTFFKK